MYRTGRFMLAFVALILVGSGSVAHAQSVQIVSKTTDGFNVRGDFNPKSAQLAAASKSTLQFDATKGRWGLKLDLDQPVSGAVRLEDVRAGAYFKLSPNVRVGGAVSLGQQLDGQALARKAQPLQQAVPRVRLETAFKF